MSERSPDIGRMIQEELDKAKAEKPKADIGGMIQEELDSADLPAAKNETIADSLGGYETKDETPARTSELDEESESAASEKKEAAGAIKIADLGAKAASKVQGAFARKKMGELGPIVDEFLTKAKDEGVDEATARNVLREQLQQFHDTYKEAGLDAQAAEIDSFGRSLETAGTVSSEAGQNFLVKLDSGIFASEADANAQIEVAVKSNKLPGTEVNVLMAKINDHFAKERADIEEQQKGMAKGVDLGDKDVDDALDNMFKETGT